LKKLQNVFSGDQPRKNQSKIEALQRLYHIIRDIGRKGEIKGES